MNFFFDVPQRLFFNKTVIKSRKLIKEASLRKLHVESFQNMLTKNPKLISLKILVVWI